MAQLRHWTIHNVLHCKQLAWVWPHPHERQRPFSVLPSQQVHSFLLKLILLSCAKNTLIALFCSVICHHYILKIHMLSARTHPPTHTTFREALWLISVWASALCTFYNNPALLNGSMQFHYCTLVTREPEQTTLLFWSAACGVTPHGLHTADRR